MRVLVTGGAGFVGRHMTAALLARGDEVRTVDLAPMAALSDGHRHSQGDMRAFLDRLLMPFDLVVHCAARAPHRAAIDGQPATMVHNTLLDAAVVDWAVHTGTRMLYLSSSAVYPAVLQQGEGARPLAEAAMSPGSVDLIGVPHDRYGWGKLHGETMATAAALTGLPVHIVRPFSGYGDDQGEDWPFGAFIARARRREDPFTVWGDGTQVRDWIHVDDLVAGALAVVDADERRPVNLGTGRGMSVDDVALAVCAAAGYQPKIAHCEGAPAGVAHRVADIRRLAGIFTPTVSLEEGVARAFAEEAA